MGHTFRVMNQNNAMKLLMAKMNNYLCIHVVFMDFKMSFETMKNCDNSVDNVGNRG